ncbi:MAG TPA: DNA-3-methyladenine glycosylase I [Myxococcota bacterium]|nr:DNA-3-methyladenine glycosylase I [Myxococcota bacterium]HRY94983.1 DNA-3-methyladenine glycosylase I [Myxococcota bacterium]HSA23921.1 DNA-3-methyladenine glycosylase I [Myxococcota bacterium]
MRTRCGWCEVNDRMRAYHDQEWGVPVHDDGKHFEFMVLDAFQAGLSWAIILDKREAFRRALAGFDPARLARFTPARLERLRSDASIVRNRLKLAAAVTNARAFLELQAAEGSFDRFVWSFVGGRPKQNAWRSLADIPPTSRESDALSAALRARGFKFVGSTICYAYMQAAGLVNDHLAGCFRHRPVGRLR